MYGDPIQTPCVGTCLMDTVTGYCLGCGRTIDEITAWPSMSEDARSDVVRRLGMRMAKLRELGRPVAHKP